LTKTLLSINIFKLNRDFPVETKTLLKTAFIAVLLLSAVAGTRFVNLTEANPYHPIWIYEGDVSPDRSTEPPTILILSPENHTVYAVDTISLSLNVSIGNSSTASFRALEEMYYETDWQSNNISVYKYSWNSLVYRSAPPRKTEFAKTINLTGIPDGNHTVVIYAIEIGDYLTHRDPLGFSYAFYYVNFNIAGSSVVSFTVDTTPPNVSVLSVENKTYDTSDVPLNFTVSESASKIFYTLDGQENVTVVGNTTLTGLLDGVHNITVYATDFAEHTGASETIYFSVEVPEPFPTTLVATASGASVAVISLGLLVYFKKRNK
jgi:hypothetical protein